MMQHGGAFKERILVKFDNWYEKREKFWWTTKRSSEILREEYKIFSRSSKNLVGPGSVRIAGGWTAYLILPIPQPLVKIRSRGVEFQPPT